MNKTIKGAALALVLTTSTVMAQSSRHLQQSVSLSPMVSSITQSQSLQVVSKGKPVTSTSTTKVVKTESLTITKVNPVKAVGKNAVSGFLARRKNAEIAESFFRKRGVVSDKAIIAILVNAWHESTWNPSCQSGSCIGFFQIMNRGGMGDGHSTANLKQLTYNITVLANSSEFKQWAKWVEKNPNVSAGEMAYRFAANVERCAVKHRAPRRTTADRWFKALESKKS